MIEATAATATKDAFEAARAERSAAFVGLFSWMFARKEVPSNNTICPAPAALAN